MLDAIINDPNKIGASSEADEEGNGKNAVRLANMQFDILGIGGTNTTLQKFYQVVIGKIGVDGQQANKLQLTLPHCHCSGKQTCFHQFSFIG